MLYGSFQKSGALSWNPNSLAFIRRTPAKRKQPVDHCWDYLRVSGSSAASCRTTGFMGLRDSGLRLIWDLPTQTAQYRLTKEFNHARDSFHLIEGQFLVQRVSDSPTARPNGTNTPKAALSEEYLVWVFF